MNIAEPSLAVTGCILTNWAPLSNRSFIDAIGKQPEL
jgi:hypothetical protein